MRGLLLYNSPPGVAYATWDPAHCSSAVTLSNHNLTATGGTNFGMCIATIGKDVASGYKGYFEFTNIKSLPSASEVFGISTTVPTSGDTTSTVGRVAQSFGPRQDSGNWDYSYNIGAGWVTVGSGTHPIVSGDVIGFAIDMGGATLDMYIQGVLTYTWSLISSGVMWYPAMVSNTTNNSVIANFGQRPFAYTPPIGYNAGWY